MGRNPKTGKPAPIPAGRLVVFKPFPGVDKEHQRRSLKENWGLEEPGTYRACWQSGNLVKDFRCPALKRPSRVRRYLLDKRRELLKSNFALVTYENASTV